MSQAAQIEYTIYTFDMPVSGKGENAWKKHASLEDMDKAIKEAEGLHQTKKYQKIEVKKKFFDQKKNRTVDMTLKVFESKPKKDRTIVIAILVAVIGGALAFATSFFLTQ
jgi:tRNA U38,U39,U40 pseudouridine synthase TruA